MRKKRQKKTSNNEYDVVQCIMEQNEKKEEKMP